MTFPPGIAIQWCFRAECSQMLEYVRNRFCSEAAKFWCGILGPQLHLHRTIWWLLGIFHICLGGLHAQRMLNLTKSGSPSRQSETRSWRIPLMFSPDTFWGRIHFQDHQLTLGINYISTVWKWCPKSAHNAMYWHWTGRRTEGRCIYALSGVMSSVHRADLRTVIS